MSSPQDDAISQYRSQSQRYNPKQLQEWWDVAMSHDYKHLMKEIVKHRYASSLWRSLHVQNRYREMDMFISFVLSNGMKPDDDIICYFPISAKQYLLTLGVEMDNPFRKDYTRDELYFHLTIGYSPFTTRFEWLRHFQIEPFALSGSRGWDPDSEETRFRNHEFCLYDNVDPWLPGNRILSVTRRGYEPIVRLMLSRGAFSGGEIDRLLSYLVDNNMFDLLKKVVSWGLIRLRQGLIDTLTSSGVRFSFHI